MMMVMMMIAGSIVLVVNCIVCNELLYGYMIKSELRTVEIGRYTLRAVGVVVINVCCTMNKGL